MNRFKRSVRLSYRKFDPSVKPQTTREIKNAQCTESEDNIALATEAFTSAFVSDPVFTYIVPEYESRVHFVRRLFTDMITLLPGRVYEIKSFSGVMLWARGQAEQPDVWTYLFNGGLWNFLRLKWSRLLSQVSFFDSLEAKRMHHLGGVADFYLLMDIGIHPTCQGKGYGSTLLKYFLLNHADVEGIPCYLEASSEGARRLYERNGFEVVETVHVPPDGPPMFLMIRKAQNSG